MTHGMREGHSKNRKQHQTSSSKHKAGTVAEASESGERRHHIEEVEGRPPILGSDIIAFIQQDTQLPYKAEMAREDALVYTSREMGRG